ncbi:Hexose carrier protein HEX6 [Ananas comosus]|uniref:Hexose carrier protein HEX6 n=1 Tax=Ananas comosus TaxID=4615 RepID=A0A199VMQ7_ANACO|nr:Hexose carrier protein HEX6 [Ananas comosus]
MAGGVHKNHETTPTYEGRITTKYEGRITAFVVLSCITAAMGGVIFGYDIGRMQEEAGEVSNYCKFDSQLLTAFTSSLYVAGLVATLLASRITGGAGRRTSMLLGGAAFVAGTAVGGAAIDVYMLILSRLLLGVGLGFANQHFSVPKSRVQNNKLAASAYKG